MHSESDMTELWLKAFHFETLSVAQSWPLRWDRVHTEWYVCRQHFQTQFSSVPKLIGFIPKTLSTYLCCTLFQMFGTGQRIKRTQITARSAGPPQGGGQGCRGLRERTRLELMQTKVLGKSSGSQGRGWGRGGVGQGTGWGQIKRDSEPYGEKVPGVTI